MIHAHSFLGLLMEPNPLTCQKVKRGSLTHWSNDYDRYCVWTLLCRTQKNGDCLQDGGSLADSNGVDAAIKDT